MDRNYSESELQTFTARLNAEGNVTPEKRQQWDLASAYDQMQDSLFPAVKDITVDDITSLHGILAHNSPVLHADQKGRFSYNPKILVNMEWDVKPFCPPDEMDARIKKYLAFYNDARRFRPESPLQYPRVIENALRAMVDFVDIHPFADGNGRMSRLLADSILIQGGLHQMPHWLPQTEGNLKDRRRLFFLMVENARRGKDALLLHFMVDQQQQAIERELGVLEEVSQTREEAASLEYLEDRQAIRKVLLTASDMLESEALGSLQDFELR